MQNVSTKSNFKKVFSKEEFVKVGAVKFLPIYFKHIPSGLLNVF